MMGDGDACTPWKLPRPDIDAICSTGQLAKKQRHDIRRSLPLESSPTTPSKAAKSKFLMPVNITPFPFSPQNLPNSQKLQTPKIDSLIHSSCHRPVKIAERNSSPLGSKMHLSMDTDLLAMSDFESSSDELTYEMDTFSSESAFLSCPWKCPAVQSLDQMYFAKEYPNICCRDCGHMENSTDYLHENYNVLECVGRGSFSDVYKVTSKIDGTLYALKKNSIPYTGISDRYRRHYFLTI